MKTTYSIIHYSLENPIGEDYYTSTVFNQTELQNQFETLVKRLKPGESAEYMKEDSKKFYPSMLYVENENGKLYSYTYTGRKKLSKYN